MRQMGTISVVALLLGLVLVLPGRAGEGEATARGLELQAARAEITASALDLLRMRLEARLRSGDVLRQLGRFDEALEAYRGVDALHAEGLGRLESLLARIEGRGAGRRAPIAVQVPEAARGRVFRGRGGAVSRPPVRKPRVLRPVVPGAQADTTHPKAGVAGTKIGIDDAPFGGAGGAFRSRGARGAAGTRRAVGAVEDALKWLTAHQSVSGGWEAAGFHKWCDGKSVEQGPDGPDGPGKPFYDAGVTGLAVCAFLGAGYTNRGRHPFAKTVSKGLRYLKNVQDAEGCFGKRTSQHYIYNHAFAALAMVEAYGMTGSPIFKGSAQKALDFAALSRNPYFGWRYGVKPGDNDTSVTAAMTMVLKSAQMVNAEARRRGQPEPLVIDDAAFDGTRAWIDKMTDPDYGRVGYIQRGGSPARPQEMIDKFPGEKSEAMTAAGIVCRIFCGEDPRKSAIIKKGADLLVKLPPTWNPNDGSIDMYYWYYGALATFQIGGRTWKVWNQALQDSVLANQRKDTTYCGYKGSWDPIGPWGADGGRVFSTAMMALTMEIYYRYDKVFGTK